MPGSVAERRTGVPPADRGGAPATGTGGTGTGSNDGGGDPGNPALAQLYGQWQGSGNQYANDRYVMRIDMTLAPDGGYLIIRDGATRDEGSYAVDGPIIRFRPDIGGEYEWRWAFGRFGARPVLRIQNEWGGILELQKV